MEGTEVGAINLKFFFEMFTYIATSKCSYLLYY